MPPPVAFAVWLILLLGLLYFDPAKDPKGSVALWVPVIWIFILGSRLPSQWLGRGVTSGVEALEEGSPIDRTILTALILLAVLTLLSRGFAWGRCLSLNMALVAFLAYALLSCCWSDFPLIALKRWFRDLGNYLMIFVILSDRCPLEAVRTVLRRLAYLLIPLSILLFKYFPEMGMQYTIWSGERMFVGATTSKNMLGVACLLSGIYFVWDTVCSWPQRKNGRVRRILAVNTAFLGMTLWVLHLSNSATSKVCLVIACIAIFIIRSQWGRRHPGYLKAIIPATFCLYLILAFGFNLNGQLASEVGRDPTLTDRTLIWNTVLALHTNPLLGTGYECFWMGPRLKWIWQAFGPINESHNGYLEVYLNLGLIGVFLIGVLLFSSYRGIWRSSLKVDFDLATLNLSIWTVMLFYNMTEAALKSGLMWLALLLGAIAVPRAPEKRVKALHSLEAVEAMSVQGWPLESTSSRRF